MNTIKTFCLLLLIFFSNSIYAQDIIGEWRTIDDETGEPKSIVKIYNKMLRCIDNSLSAHKDRQRITPISVNVLVFAEFT